MNLDYTVLPAVNATLNSIATVFLSVGWMFIRRGEITRHRACMISAFATSALFLISYVVYFTILITHITLAALILPLALVTLSRALSRRFDRHRAIARWTLPIWLYVSITGVVIYVMLYRL